MTKDRRSLRGRRQLEVHHVVPNVSGIPNIIHPPHAGILFQRCHLLKGLPSRTSSPVTPQFRVVKIDPFSHQPQGRLRTQITQENILTEIDLCLVALILGVDVGRLVVIGRAAGFEFRSCRPRRFDVFLIGRDGPDISFVDCCLSESCISLPGLSLKARTGVFSTRSLLL